MRRLISIPQLYIDPREQTSTVETFPYQTAGFTQIDPSNISYVEERRVIRGMTTEKYAIIHTLNGSKIYSAWTPKEVREEIEKFYDERSKEEKDSITITKDDIVKNFIFKNIGG